MRLTLAYHPITDMRFGASTRLYGTTLEVSQAALRQYLLEDRRLQDVDLALVQPAEACRFGVVFDIMEPRAKDPNDGPDFPGILDAIAMVGQGTTHVLQGAAVTVLDAAAPLAGGNVVEMSGEAGQACPYAALSHLVVIPRTVPGLERPRVQQALRLATVKTAVYMGRTALGQAPMDSEAFDSPGPVEASRPGLPRLAYIGQIHSRQRVAEVDEQILYGANTVGMAPVLLHPNEWLDGALVTSYSGRAVETYFYQNHPIITALYRWQREGKISLVGTIATMAGSDNNDRARNAMLAAQQAKWALAADGVILTKYGGGAPHADMALTAKLCEDLGLRTVVQVSDMSADRRAESALLFNYPEVDAIVYVGGNDTQWQVPAVPRVIAGSPEAAAALEVAQVLSSGRLCGVTSQQGASHLRAFVH